MRRSKILLIILALSFVLFGVIEGVMRPADLTFIHSIIIAILIFMWCRAHAEENEISSSSAYRLLATFIPPLGVPLYFYRFFGLKSGSIKLAKTVLYTILLLVLYLVPYELINL